MTYDLAKQLKDAGFPGYEKYSEPQYLDSEHWVIWMPTLSELIEACGDRFWRLEMFISAVDNGKSFIATAHPVKPASSNGSTPEDAVAKLWLALNKKL